MQASPKMIGCCTRCDKEVFHITKRDASRRPLEIGPPDPKAKNPQHPAHADAMRVTFVLVDGSRLELTFCESCASSLVSAENPFIWRRVMAGWVEEVGPDHPTVKQHAANGILGMFGMKYWREVSYPW